jgi:NitT/TauT family transport system permease protein
MRVKVKDTLKIFAPVVFWLLVWEIASLIINHPYFLPSVPKTVSALFTLLKTGSFYITVFMTALRVLAGLLIGIILGALLSYLSYKIELVNIFLTPFMTVIKSTPVASMIILLWILLSGGTLAVLIAVLMVMPIMYQNLLNGFYAVSKELYEVSLVFGFNFKARMKYLIIPTLKGYFIPALISCIGLAWKSEIAAEIIAYTENSIGYYINDAKSFYLSDTVFAWTLVIIVMSILLEKITKILIYRCNYELGNKRANKKI